jgi:hypothetical protein
METQMLSVTAFEPPQPPKAAAVHNFPLRKETREVGAVQVESSSPIARNRLVSTPELIK